MGIFGGKNPPPQGFSLKWIIRLAIFGFIISIAFRGINGESEPTESQCRPYIEKALKEQQVESEDNTGSLNQQQSSFAAATQEENEINETAPDLTREEGELEESSVIDEEVPSEEQRQSLQETEEEDAEHPGEERGYEQETEEAEQVKDEKRVVVEEEEEEEEEEKEEGKQEAETEEKEEKQEAEAEEERLTPEEEQEAETEEKEEEKQEAEAEEERLPPEEEQEAETEEKEEEKQEAEAEEERLTPEEEQEAEEEEGETPEEEQEAEEEEGETPEEVEQSKQEETPEEEGKQEAEEEGETSEEGKIVEEVEQGQKEETPEEEGKTVEEEVEQGEKEETPEEEIVEQGVEKEEEEKEEKEEKEKEEKEEKEPEEEEQELAPEEDLTKEVIIPENLRPRDHITKILRLDEESVETESAVKKTIDSTLKNLKGLYDSAIKPLEMLYKYRDLSNRHFGDPEIFSKPLIVFMGPWSGGKSSTINYLLDNEFTEMSLRTGAEPSPAYFNILMYGSQEILDGTQLAADWTFSGLQKFGQSLLDRLKGYKLPNRLLEKVNIVEIPGILEIRKQVQRLFPFNDACQWFIDRADIIFLVYDPSKLDVGPETEAILDQLKGREYQTRIILNKADRVKPEELMRVQGTLIWNISPLMSSTEPPVMYTTSLWSMPYENGSPTRLLMAQERAFLRDLREAIDKRVENKIASARRFAVRVRNHAKMVDCYLTTYYNHKTFFGNKKKISDEIIENPQKYHIYEGLSTLTNISRYDLPDPDVYRDFFRLNPLYDFTKLSDTCTYFRGCPINTLDVAIAYDLPELIGKYKKSVEATQKNNS